MATKKTAAKKTSAKKSAPAKKSTAKKAPAKKSAAKKTAPAKRSTADKATASADTDESTSARSRKSTDAPRSARKPAARKGPAEKRPAEKQPEPAKKSSGMAIAAQAARQLLELTGRDIEGVTGFGKNDDGWRVQVEVLEVRRIPDTTDVLALYEVEVDGDGDMTGYRRLRRYVRGTPGEE